MTLDQALTLIETSGTTIHPNQNCWVVRCDNGLYFNHFLTHSIVAIGHLDELNYENIDSINFKEALLELATKYQDRGQSEEPARRSAQRQITLANIFLNEIHENDLVITIESGKIAIGHIRGKAYIARSGLNVHHTNQEVIEMQLYLRRSVDWQYVVPRDKVPSKLAKTLTSPQTVYNVSRKLDVYHMIYPTFMINNDWHFSINLNRAEAIKNKQVVDLLSFFNKMESYIYAFDQTNISTQSLDTYIIDNELMLEIKASFMSPGEFWGMLKDIPDRRRMIWATLIYSFVFGNNMLGFEGIIDQEIRHQIFEMVKENIENSEIIRLKEDLQLKKPDFEIATV